MKFKRLITTMLLSAGIIIGGVAISQTSTVTASAKTTWIKGVPKALRNTKWRTYNKDGENYLTISFWNSEISGIQYLNKSGKYSKYDKSEYEHNTYYHHASGSRYYYLRTNNSMKDPDTYNNKNVLVDYFTNFYRVKIVKSKIQITEQPGYYYTKDIEDSSVQLPKQSTYFRDPTTPWISKVK